MYTFQCPPEYSDNPTGKVLYHISAAQMENEKRFCI